MIWRKECAVKLHCSVWTSLALFSPRYAVACACDVCDTGDANIQHDIVALSTLHQSASQAHAGNYQEARINMLRTLRLLQRQLDVTKGYTRALDQYVAFILQGEQLDGFMREAMAWHAVHGHATPDPANGKRDDPASRAMYQMKQLSIGALSEMAVLV
eukprot:m.539807 g.539807  ORF g.539807 m.539807 type:complete len:158 (-) comp22093_c0_seq1:103-576(-)